MCLNILWFPQVLSLYSDTSLFKQKEKQNLQIMVSFLLSTALLG